MESEKNNILKKIIICGFSHCGTTILNQIIGHIKEVKLIRSETQKINIKKLYNFNKKTKKYKLKQKDKNKKFVLCKYPQAKKKFFDKEYDDYIKIFIIRNPLFVFSSLNRRYEHYNLSEYHSIEKYINIIKMFIEYKNKPVKNVYTIRYEDMFKNNFSELKNILNNIGMNYDDDIFINEKYNNVSHPHQNINIEKLKNIKSPNESNHKEYRSWQVNQPIKFNDNFSKIDLSESQKKILINNPYIQQIYPDIKLFNK